MRNIHIYSAELPAIGVLENLLFPEDFENWSVQEDFEGKIFYQECSKSSFSSFGFSPVKTLTRLSNGYKMLFVYEAKSISTKAIATELKRRIAKLEQETTEPLMKSQRQALKENVLKDLCEKAFTEITTFEAFYHEKNQKLVMDVTSEGLANMALSRLTHVIGSMKTETLHVSELTNSLSKNILDSLRREEEMAFAGFTIGEKLNLINCDKDKAKLSGEYMPEHVRDLLEDDYTIELVTLKKDGLSFDLTDKFKIKSIKVDSNLTDELENYDDAEDFRLHEQAVTLELITDHCNSLITFFDKNVA